MIANLIFISAVLGAVGTRIAVVRMFDAENDPVLRDMVRKNLYAE